MEIKKPEKPEKPEIPHPTVKECKGRKHWAFRYCLGCENCSSGDEHRQEVSDRLAG